MKRIYFDLDNGVVRDPYAIFPKYMAIVKRGKVKELYTCFRVQNIADKGGQKWVDAELEDERKDWGSFHWLTESLNKYINHPKHWFKDTNHIEETFNRFIYIRFK